MRSCRIVQAFLHLGLFAPIQALPGCSSLLTYSISGWRKPSLVAQTAFQIFHLHPQLQAVFQIFDIKALLDG